MNSVERPDDVVGHKTFSNGDGTFRHEPLTRSEGEAMWAAAEAAKEKRTKEMPDERSALLAMFEAYQRLKELGWNNWMYMPKDGTVVDLIEAGSTGVHQGHYEGKWPDGSVWIHAEGDQWPSHPILFRKKQEPKP